MHNQGPTQRKIAVLSWAVLFLIGLVSALPLIPPAPERILETEDFSVDNAVDHIALLAQAPRPMGSAANGLARDEIAQELSELGLSPQVQSIRVRNYFSRAGELVDVVNVMARIPGADSTGAVLLMGHHDTVPTTLGANDDTGAVAILLEVARALGANESLRNDVILLFTDGEEPAPHFGSTAFINQHPWAADIRFVINLEAIGSTGAAIIVEINGSTRWISALYARSVPYPAAYSAVTSLAALVGGSNTDFSTFRDAGVPGLDIAYMTGSPIYHTMADTPGTVSARTLYQHGANALALVRSVGNLDLGIDRGDAEATFFTIARFVSIRYPGSWSIPLLAIAALLTIAVSWRQRCMLQTLLRSTITVSVLVAAAIVAAIIWMSLAQARSTMGIVESYMYLVAFLALTALLSGAIARLLRHRIKPSQDGLAAILVWWLFGLLTALAIPGASYLFVWPTIVGGLILLRPQRACLNPVLGLIEWFVLSGVTLTVLVPAIDFFYQFAQPRPGNPDSEVLPTIIIPVILIALAFELLRSFHRRMIAPCVPRI